MARGRFILGLLSGVVLTGAVAAGGLYAFGGVIAPLLMGAPSIPKPPAATASAASQQAMADARARVEADDKQDFADADRGFIATRADPLIRKENGDVVFDLNSYAFLNGPAPDTANPSLWRQAQILTKNGLFKVSDRIYQVRGFDVSTVSFIDAGAGWIVVDPLTTVEVAKAALDLVNEKVGAKPVIAVVYSHSHADHYGGVLGVTTREDVASGKVKVIAPDGFMEHAVSENIIAGPAMARRARFQFGLTLPRGADGEMTSGLGPGISRGTISLVAPTDLVTRTGQTITVGDVKLEFQITPGTEAPSEMNFYLPQFRALFMAENANLTMHNLLPARGALVRDAKAWADYLTQAIRLYADKSDVMFAAHGIPRFGQANIATFLASHRDAYKYLHDQSVRLMNAGLNGAEIAEVLKLPDVLAKQWFNRGYYGTMSHNAKAVYQRYMGWYDANPANLWPLPQEESAVKYVEAMGGAEAVMARAKTAADAGDYRWAATLLNNVVFAGGETTAAREQLAAIYTQLGYQAEAGTWRNIYLTGAQELRNGPLKLPPTGLSPDVLQATSTAMLLDFAAVRINPDRALQQDFKINLVLTDTNETHLITVENGVLIHEEGVTDPAAGATVRLKRLDLMATLFAGVAVETRGIESDGDGALYGKLAGLIDPLDPNFNIVTP
ncbi:Putative alkyl/aryl-sulfatase YjcS [Alphaproteobacteria bacterium SO-S41]|nr:Putative alkyl/aryl-sulfatase YjcS [Alphaproteobacteria bacterium SO-S41]